MKIKKIMKNYKIKEKFLYPFNWKMFLDGTIPENPDNF